MNKNIILKASSSIKEALKVIDKGAIRIALVVRGDESFVGTLSDGDIRRGLLLGLDLNDSIESVINKSPVVIHQNTSPELKNKILAQAVNKKIDYIPILSSDNKIISLEKVEDLKKFVVRKNSVVLMVGGLGTRLGGLTKSLPKPMLNVGNKPILETIVEQFCSFGFKNIIMCLNYKADIIKEYFGDGSRLGANINYILEPKRLGTAGALSMLTDLIKDDFFVMNGDVLTNLDFSKLCEYHIKQKNQATMCIREYEMQIPYGVVEVENNLIKKITEKPVRKFFVSAGVYMLSPQILEFVPKNEFFDMPSLFDILLAKNYKIGSFEIRDYWLDIGLIEEYKRANLEFNEVF